MISSDLEEIRKNVNNTYNFRNKYSQKDYNYLSDPGEIDARIFNAKTLMKEQGIKTAKDLYSWSQSNRKSSKKQTYA